MDSNECPGNDALSSAQPGPWLACGIPSASVEEFAGIFSGEQIDLALPCTGTKSQACHIVRSLSTWNEILFQVDMEIRELPGPCSELSVGNRDNSYVMGQDEGMLRKVATVLFYLIKRHRCVTELDVVIGKLYYYDALLCDALSGNEHIERLKLHGPGLRAFQSENIFSAIPFLKNLKHFDCPIGAKLEQPFLEALSTLVRTTRTLETLDIPSLEMKGETATTFLTALRSCPSLRHLSLNVAYFEDAPFESCEAFAGYLKNSSTLTTLSLVGPCCFRAPSSKEILRALGGNKSILKLKMQLVTLDAEATEIIASICAQNTTLRIFCVLPSVGFYPHRFCDGWLPVFVENKTLEEINLPFRIWRPQQWAQIFLSVSRNPNLKRVTISSPSTSGTDIYDIAEALRESGAEEKVTFERCHITHRYLDSLRFLRCKSLVDVSACSYFTDDSMQLERMVCELSGLNHLASLTLEMPSRDLTVAIPDYIETATKLKKLCLYFRPVQGDVNISWKRMIESLSRNRSITQLSVEFFGMEANDAEQLAQVIRCSENVRKFSIMYLGRQPMDTFLKHLSSGIASNYTLVSVVLPRSVDRQTFAVYDTARRNCSLVAHAFYFQAGAQLDRRNAGALERVFQHRALLEEFADLKCMTLEEAAAAVKTGLGVLDNMHAFMRLAGVVRSSVACHAREDGRTQLEDLDRDCWKALRRYIMLDDVVSLTSQTFGPQ